MMLASLICVTLSAVMLWQALGLARQRSVTRALARGDIEAAGGQSLQSAMTAWINDVKGYWATLVEKRIPTTWLNYIENLLLRAGRGGLRPGLLIVTGMLQGTVAGLLMLLLAPMLSLPALLLGLALPLIRLNDDARVRIAAIQRGLSDAVDLVAACVLAGLSLDQALARVTPRLGEGPLKKELERTLVDLNLGRGRKDALRGLQARASCSDVDELVVAMIQADQQGTALAPTLRSQSRQLRAMRALRAQKMAAEAPLKLLFPLMVFILPVVFIVLLAPIFLAFQNGGL